MSHGTGESWAEVEFEVNDQQYRSKWGQYRARRKPEGNLQDPKMELSERKVAEDGTETWPFLETMKRNVPVRVAELSGLEYKQFLRSVLLAQGDFTRFLKAPAGERAQLLEKITDTRKYSDISRAAFERAKQETQQVEQLRAGLAGLVLLSPEEVSSLESEIQELTNQLTTATAAQEHLREARQWQLRLRELRLKLQTTQERQQQLQLQAETLVSIRQRVAVHQQAAPFRTPWALLQQADTHLQRLHHEAEQFRRQLPQQQEQLAQVRQARQAAQTVHQQAQAVLQQQEPELREAERLDSLIGQAEAQLIKEKQEYDLNNEQCKRRKAEADQATTRLHTLQHTLHHLDKWLTDNARLSELADILPELSANAQDWDSLATERGQLNQRLSEAQQRLRTLQTAAEQHQKEAAQAHRQLEQLAADQAAATAEHSTWLRRLCHHVAFLHQEQEQQQQHWDDLRRSVHLQQLVLSHAETRQLLIPGQACPVCGATEHPYLAGVLGVSEDGFQRDQQREEALSQRVRALGTRFNHLNTFLAMLEQLAPEPSPSDEPIPLLAEADEKAASDTIKALVKHIQDLARQRTSAELQLQQANTQHHHAARQAQDFTLEAQKISALLADNAERTPVVKEMLTSLLANFGIAFQGENGRGLLEQAGRRSAEFRQRQQQRADAERELGELKAAAAKAEAEKEQLQAWLSARKQALVEQHAAIQAQQKQRQQLFAGPDVTAALQQLAATVEQAAREMERRQQLEQEQETALALATAALRQREQDAQRQQQQRQQQHDELVAALTGAGLAPDPATLPALLLDDHEMRQLADQLRQHEQEVAAAQHALADITQQLQQEDARALSPEPLEQLEAQLTTTNQQLAALNQQLGQRQERLGSHQSGLERHAALALELEKQQQEARRWRQLAELIGSADGKKFSEFAQGLTLARLIDLANRHLHRFTDRYRILRNPEQHLDLLIQDDYQASSVRTMNSLSGGESFLVSLALALGLSELAGRKTQIDTLFIDEGFGTLDPDTLDVALSALEMLQGTGKTIGIISHVEALKERVTTQINIRKGAGGFSSIQVLGFGEEV
jgi:exonuclease SbcC